MLNKKQSLGVDHSTLLSTTSVTRVFRQNMLDRSEDVKALREFIDWESEFMTTASDMTAVVL